MAPKNESKVLIGGNVYTLSGDESEEYLQRVALYMNKKMDEVRNSDNGKKLNTRLQSVLLAINIADDYFKIKTNLEGVEEEQKKQEHTLHELEAAIEGHKAKEEDYRNEVAKLKSEIEHYRKELDDYIELFEQSNQ